MPCKRAQVERVSAGRKVNGKKRGGERRDQLLGTEVTKEKSGEGKGGRERKEKDTDKWRYRREMGGFKRKYSECARRCS